MMTKRPTRTVAIVALLVSLALGARLRPFLVRGPTAPTVQLPATVTAAPHPVDAYARAVVDGTVPAGKYHRLACERHLRDRAREGTAAFPYRFEAAKADRFFRFAAKLKHYKGEWAGSFIVLQPWQQFRLGSIFGWVHVDTGLRRFRTAYNEVPRKNGKSLEAAVVALYVTFYDSEPGAEGYCLATQRSQAMLVFRDAVKLVRSSGLKTRLQIHARTIFCTATSSKLEALGANPQDGLNPNLIIIDEFHKLTDRELIDVMETATGARRQPLSFQITTAGDDPVSPCGDQHGYAVQILEGVLVDETFFGFIAHADVGDDWTLEATARKANPNFGVSIKPDDLAALVTKATGMPAAAAAYQQKRLNLWVNTAQPWLSLEGWRKGQTRWTLEELRGETCWGAIDLSSKIDLAAFVLVFPPTPTRPHWRYVVWCFTPADTLLERARRDRAPYLQWVDERYLSTNPGNRLDQDLIQAAVTYARDVLGFNIQQIGFDPWNAGNLEKDLQEDGFEVLEIPQTLAHMSAPSKDFEADVLDGLADAGGNPLMAWSISNVVVYRDGKDNIYPQKKRSRGRIDPVVAAIMARKLAELDASLGGAEDPVLTTA
jgi:phage terminase large subunit-like protein